MIQNITTTASLGIALVLSLLSNPTTAAQPNKTPDSSPTHSSAASGAESRGEMLYSVSCSACHATEVHWRAKKLATDPERLRHEVQRWKDNVGAEWNDDDVNEVARYLDAAFYRFANANTSEKGGAPADTRGEQRQFKPQKQGNVSYISGGLQPEERRAMLAIAGEYSLKLTFSHKAKNPDPFFSDIRISIIGARQETMLSAVANGPLFLANLPAGRYQVKIENGRRHVSKSVTIRKGRSVALRF